MRANMMNNGTTSAKGVMILAFFLLISPQISIAQSEQAPTKEAEKPAVRILPPAYNKQMLRLAEILGAIHYLRDLCDAKEGLLWREQMENIIAGEEPSPERKAELIGQFNRGFRTFREIYRECTPTAIEAVNLYMRQGRRLAGKIPSRYGR